MSSSINITSGVLQGSVLSPIFFLIYINDLPDYIQNTSSVKLFADRHHHLPPHHEPNDSNALQEDLDALRQWESDWLMHFHPQKYQTRPFFSIPTEKIVRLIELIQLEECTWYMGSVVYHDWNKKNSLVQIIAESLELQGKVSFCQTTNCCWRSQLMLTA